MTEIRTSIIIVSYNVAGFISFCLDSILKSVDVEGVEVIVVDNNSTDDSVALIEKNYPDVQIIINNSNFGFSKACNQGAKNAKGDILLFLNPDCIIEETAIQRLAQKANEDGVGLVGPILIDGAGHVLPESAREVPSTLSGLNKILGLPFNESFPYYKNITSGQNIEAPVLCGACIAVSTSVYEEIGGFDERFFMYGEDVDISVQSLGKGYKNICLTGVRVLHFKGESTDKKDLQNNYNFYNAIKLYVEKHSIEAIGPTKKVGIGLFASSFSSANYAGYRLKEWTSILSDFIIVVFSMWALQFVWSYVKIHDWFFYGYTQYLLHYILYGFVWILALYISGVYFIKKRIRSKVYKGGLFGGVLLLLIYALLPEYLRFSRMILVLSIFVVPIILAVKHGLNRSSVGVSYVLSNNVSNFVNRKLVNSKVSSNIEELAPQLTPGDEVVFDISSIQVSEMLRLMMDRKVKVAYKFWDNKEEKFFSSTDRTKMGESSDSMAYYHLSQRTYLLQKRIVDLLFVITLYIPLAFLSRFKMGYVHDVIKGDRTIVGYDATKLVNVRLPAIMPSIIPCYSAMLDQVENERVALDYAVNYTIFDDIFIVITQFKHLTKVIMKGKVEVHEGRD